MTFDEVLLAFAEILLDHVCQLATGLAVEGFHVDKHGFVVPLARLLILALVVDREAEGRDLASRGKTSHLRVARQSTDQHYFVQIRHSCLPGDEAKQRSGFPMTFRFP